MRAEILEQSARKIPGVTRRWPWLASFGFGLLHGFGFAAALHDIGLPDGAIPLALLFFNVGRRGGSDPHHRCRAGSDVRLAQDSHRRRPPGYTSRPPYLAGIVGCFWFCERALHILL